VEAPPRKDHGDALSARQVRGHVSRKRKNGEQFTAPPCHHAAARRKRQKPIGFLLISKDISDEIRMAQYARSLIEASLDPLVTISADGKITDATRQPQGDGCTREKLIARTFPNYFTEPDKAQEGYRQVFAKGMGDRLSPSPSAMPAAA